MAQKLLDGPGREVSPGPEQPHPPLEGVSRPDADSVLVDVLAQQDDGREDGDADHHQRESGHSLLSSLFPVPTSSITGYQDQVFPCTQFTDSLMPPPSRCEQESLCGPLTRHSEQTLESPDGPGKTTMNGTGFLPSSTTK